LRGNRRSIAVLPALAAALLTLSACGGDATPGATPTAPSVTAGSPTPTATSSPIVEATQIEIQVSDGEVESPGVVGVKVGDRVRIRVRADVADQVHVHGYDLLADVSPGNPATIKFAADVAGVFEVELENASLLLLRLKVNP
jgi:heme/copper-type cytochrome/quinol oxidase subunit 2